MCAFGLRIHCWHSYSHHSSLMTLHTEHSIQYKLSGRTNILPIGISFRQRTHLPNSGVPTLDSVNSNAASLVFACSNRAVTLLLLLRASFLDSRSIAQSGATGLASSVYKSINFSVLTISSCMSCIKSLFFIVCVLYGLWVNLCDSFMMFDVK